MANNSNNTIKVNVTSDISSFMDNLGKIQTAINKLDLTQTDRQGFDKTFRQIKSKYDDLMGYVGNNELRFIDNDKVQKIFKDITELYNKLNNNIQSKGLFDKPLKETAKLEQELEKIKETYKDINTIEKQAARNTGTNKQGIKTAKDTIDSLKTQIELVKQYQKAREDAEKRVNNRYKVDKTKEFDFGAERSNSKFWETPEGKAFTEAEEAIKNLLETENKTIEKNKDFVSGINAISEKYDKATDKVNKFDKEVDKLKVENLKSAQEALLKLGFVPEEVQTAKQIEEILANIHRVSEDMKGDNPLKKMGDEADKTDKSLDNLNKELDKTDKEVKQLTLRQETIESMQKKLTAFFGIDNAVRLFRRALQSSFQAIKELDAAMTEMAVVTKLDVGDYWDQLPEYTQRANDLGVATKSAYEAATLYYQQGLKTKQVVELSIPTLRMARIAGLDAAEATDRMTNALRGFNMELNETNANRVADVYSKLAAITASNVDEISTAMTKTASIASNAGMAFETTAAFLSQIIETTRESAETAGTALKTVIARFQELKKDPKLIGEVDGEVVDANKIETALRTVGVALRDSAGQFRNLDDVFMELAQKWDSLDTNTQRYIATIAAGSRQQSRFIAMMSNYQHTVELVNAANASAGASTEQFNKTLDSLESKLAKLKNAWNEFTMGLANSDLVKFGVDLLTTILNIINGITKGWDNASSSILKFAAAFGMLKASRAILGALFQSAGKGIPVLQQLSKNLAGFGNIADGVNEKTSLLTLTQIYFTKTTKLAKTAQIEEAAATALQSEAFDLLTKRLAKVIVFFSNYGKIIAIVAAAIAVLVIAYKAIKAASPESQLEKAKEATQQAAEAAERAAEAYESLNNALDGLRDKYKAIDELTKGTTAWSNAIQEANSSVLTLINEYPELARLMSMRENGLLSIDLDSAEVQKVINSYQQRSIGAQIAEGTRRINQQQLQDRVDIREFGRSTGLGEELATKIVEAYRKGDIYRTTSGFDTTDEYLKEFMSSLSEASEELLSLAGKLSTSDANTKAQYQSMIAAAYGAVNQQQFTSEQLKQMQAFATTDYMKDLVAKETALYSEKMTETADYGLTAAAEKAQADAMKDYAEAYYAGMNYKIRGNQIVYRDENGKKQRDTISIKDLSQNAGSLAAQRKLTETLVRVPEAIRSLSGSRMGATAAKNLFSQQEGQGLTLADIRAIKEAKDSLEGIYKNSKDLQEMYGSYDNFIKKIENDMAIAESSFQKATKYLYNLGLEALPQSIAAGAKNALVDNLEIVMRESGKGGVKAVYEIINPILQELADKNTEKAQSFASALAAITWTSEESIEGLSDVVKELGLEGDIGADKIKELEQAIDEFAGATNGLDLDKLNTKPETLGDTINKVVGNINDNTTTYTKEERDNLIDKGFAGYDDFVKTLEGEYVYLNSQVELLQKIYEETSRILGEQEDDLQRNIKQGQDFGQVYENSTQMFTVGTGDLAAEYTLQGLVRSLNSGELTTGYVGKAVMQQLASALGLQGSNSESILQDLKDSFERYNQVGINQQKLNELQQDQNVYGYTVFNSGQEITDRGINDRADAEKALEGLITRSLGYKTAAQEVNKSLERQGSLLSKNSLLIKAHAKDNQDNKVSLEKMAQALNDYVQALEEGKDGYAEFEIMQNSFAATYGKSVRNLLTPELVHNNVKLFQDMMDEDVNVAEEAFKKIQEYIRNTFKNDKDYQALPNTIKEAVEELETLMPIEGTMDISNIISGIANIYGYGTEVFNKLKEYLQSAFNITINTEGFDTVTAKWGKEANSYLKQGYSIFRDNEDGTVILQKLGVGITSSNDTPFKPTDKGTAKTLENQYDWLYNLTSHIAQKTAEKAREEKKYALLLKTEGSSMEAITASYEAQESALRSQAIMQEKMVQSRESELNWIMSQYADVGSYANWKDGRVNIDWNKIEAVKNSGNEELMERINDYISQLEHADSERSSALDALLDIESSLQSMREQLTQAYLSMEKRIQDAIIYDRQSKIDRDQEVLDAYANANSDLIDCINKNISKLRQDRENDKTERNISTLEQRRAYLIASGASAKEIKQIDEQLNEAKENYTDSLIDQAINNLEEYNEQAVDQRQRMIDLEQSQLEWDKENGVIARQAYEKLINLKTDDYGVLDTNDPNTAETLRILQNAEGFQSMSMAQGSEWRIGLTNAIHEALLAYNEGAVAEDNNDYEQMMIDRFAERGYVDQMMYYWNGLRNNKIDRLGLNPDWKIEDKNLENYLRNKTGANIKGFNAKEEVPPSQTDALNYETTPQQTTTEPKLEVNKHAQIKDTATNFGSLSGGANIASFLKNSVGLIKDIRDNQAAFYLTDENGNPIGFTGWIKVDDLKPLAYAQGGLADFTGPAWLDGTKSKPEVVLDAADSANFIQLRDILRNLLPGITNTNTSRDAYFNFEVNVDQIANDYDVEQLAQTVKTIINREGAYRNVNNLSRVR